MIGKLTGRFDSVGTDGAALIEVGGVGYAVRMPVFALQSLRGNIGPVSLFIHTAVREDAIELYGFATGEELDFFRQLMGVSGIGPKSALGVMNVAEVPALKRSIAQGDATALTKVFGIGKKSAERIIVELRDKLAKEMSGRGTEAGVSGSDVEVIEALMALGYRADEGRSALKEIGAVDGTRERLAATLKYLGSAK